VSDLLKRIAKRAKSDELLSESAVLIKKQQGDIASLIDQTSDLVKRVIAVNTRAERFAKRIAGMCDAPSRCQCGRPNGLTAVKLCAESFIKEIEMRP
jgi:hypothetical protein